MTWNMDRTLRRQLYVRKEEPINVSTGKLQHILLDMNIAKGDGNEKHFSVFRLCG